MTDAPIAIPPRGALPAPVAWTRAVALGSVLKNETDMAAMMPSQ